MVNAKINFFHGARNADYEDEIAFPEISEFFSHEILDYESLLFFPWI